MICHGAGISFRVREGGEIGQRKAVRAASLRSLSLRECRVGVNCKEGDFRGLRHLTCWAGKGTGPRSLGMGQALRKPVEERIEGRLEFLNTTRRPVMVRAHRAESLRWLLDTARDSVDDVLRQFGAILFRGFDDMSTAVE